MESDQLEPGRLQILNDALKALLVTLQPTPASNAARKQVVSVMQQLVTAALPAELHCGVETFGSYRAGLHLPGSDMDFALTGWVTRSSGPISDPCGSDDDQISDHHDHDDHDRDLDHRSEINSSSCLDPLEPCSQQQQRHGSQQQQQQQQQQQRDEVLELYEWTRLDQEYLLADLADALEMRGLVQGQVERVLHARVPVIKFIHKQTGLRCDFSISRPECAFKAEMQKLLGSLDRRYAALYRLVKSWAAAHGLNDAASSTLNSWSLGLMVAFYMQCEQPALLPPIWQLLERNPPSMRAPRILQQPGVTSAALKHTLNLAATSAGAYMVRKTRQGTDASNPKTLAELLLGFFEFFGAQMEKWVSGESKGCRASTWWGRWVDVNWPPRKPYIFSVEDPFKADDNTARSVGTHNILSCIVSASYIAWAVKTSAQLMRQALTGAAAAVQDGSSSSNAGGRDQQILAAFCWLFGPAAVLDLQQQQQQRVDLPVSLHDQLMHQIPSDLLDQLTQQITSLDNCSAALADSSSIACVNSNNSSATDEEKIEQIQTAVELFKQLLQHLDAPVQDVCLGDYQVIHRRQQQLLTEQRDQDRQLWKQQQQHGVDGSSMLRQRSTPSAPQSHQTRQQQRQQYGVSDRWRSKSSSAAAGYDGAAAAAAAAAAQGLGALSPPAPIPAAAGRGRGSRRASLDAQDSHGSSSSRRGRGRDRAPANPAEWFEAGSPPAAAAAGRGRGRGRGSMLAGLQMQGSLDSDHMPTVGSLGSSNSSSRHGSSTQVSAGRQLSTGSSGRDRGARSAGAFSAPANAGGMHMARAAMQAAAASTAAVDGLASSSSRRGRGRGSGRFIAQQQQQGFQVSS